MDITSRKRAEQALLLEQERYRIALRSVTDVLFEYDVEQDALIEFERGVATADGAPPEERRYPRYTASAESGRIHPDDFRRLSEALRDDGSTTMEVRHRVAGGGDAWRWVRMHALMLRNAEGRPVRTIGSWKDVTEERRRIEQLVDQARRDPLTKLLNQGRPPSWLRSSCLHAPSAEPAPCWWRTSTTSRPSTTRTAIWRATTCW